MTRSRVGRKEMKNCSSSLTILPTIQQVVDKYCLSELFHIRSKWPQVYNSSLLVVGYGLLRKGVTPGNATLCSWSTFWRSWEFSQLGSKSFLEECISVSTLPTYLVLLYFFYNFIWNCIDSTDDIRRLYILKYSFFQFMKIIYFSICLVLQFL